MHNILSTFCWHPLWWTLGLDLFSFKIHDITEDSSLTIAERVSLKIADEVCKFDPCLKMIRQGNKELDAINVLLSIIKDIL